MIRTGVQKKISNNQQLVKAKIHHQRDVSILIPMNFGETITLENFFIFIYEYRYHEWSIHMLALQKIVEKKIKEAEKEGAFDNLPGKGRPLNLEDDTRLPEELRIAYKILKNANCLPPELELKKEISRMEEMLSNIPDEKEKYRLIQKINLVIMKLNMMGHKSPLMEEDQIYYARVMDRLAKK